MFIDIHTHITYHRFPEFAQKLGHESGFTAEMLLKRMDVDGIDKSVILPLENPENKDLYGLANTFEALESARKYPDRLIAFCNVDPRAIEWNAPNADLSKVLMIYKEMGCKGVGEICSNIHFDDERAKNFFYHCGECEMPILFHMADKKIGGVYGLVDDIYIPRLEKVLKEFSRTIFIGHAMSFWAEIDGDVDNQARGGYPKGKIERTGRLQELLRRYHNLYAELSAPSGYNAISRDLNYSYKFLEEFHRKLLLGTDRWRIDVPIPPIIGFIKNALKEKKISQEAYENITYKNAQKLIEGCKK